jgi:hypothetical protein
VNWRAGWLAVLGCLLAGVSHAQTQVIRPAYQFPETNTSGDRAASVQMGDSPFFFTPYIGVAAGRDSNLFYAPNNERASNLYVVSPGFKIDARTEASVVQLTHLSQFGEYTSSSDDDYQDHTTRFQADTAFDQRTFLRFGYDYLHLHDPRGSTDRAVSTRPDVYRLSTPSVTFAYGAPGAQGRVEAYYSEGHKDYLNNRETTEASDRLTREYGGAFYWRVAPKTYALAEVRLDNLLYDDPASPSSHERRYYLGVSWEATAATTGTVKVGRLEKKFDNGELPDFSGSSWEADILWAPRTYSKFDFFTARQTNESTGLGNFILTDYYGVNWNHDWSSKVTTGILARYQTDDYQGFDRRDKTTTLGFKVGYRFRRWCTLGAEYDYTHRDSSLDNFDYDKSLYLLTATLTL